MLLCRNGCVILETVQRSSHAVLYYDYDSLVMELPSRTVVRTLDFTEEFRTYHHPRLRQTAEQSKTKKGVVSHIQS
eukprot:scaffold60416_cov81-Cyclotella_meneghiniana.AAC.7